MTHPAHQRIEKANEIAANTKRCPWCSHYLRDPESPHHRLCCRDNNPPWCDVCKVDLTARPAATSGEDRDADMAADRYFGGAS